MQNAPATAHPKFAYERRSAEDSLLRQVLVQQWPGLQREIRDANDGRGLPKFLTKAVNGFLECGLLPKGFLRVHCKSCKTDQFVAFSCKSRGICSSCDGKRMTELAAHLCDSVIPVVPVRQYVLTVPGNLRYVLAWNHALRGKVLAAFMRALEKHYVRLAEDRGAQEPKFGAISVLQRWDGALRIFPHWHVLAADGVWHQTPNGLQFMAAEPLRDDQLQVLLADVIKRVTRQTERHFKKLDEASDADPLQEADPAFAALLRQSLLGKHEAERVVPTVSAGPALKFTEKSRNCLEAAGFNLHANTTVHAVARERLEHLVRYVCRPAIAAKRIETVGAQHIRIKLKNEWKGGITAVLLTRKELATRILAQIPLPRRASVHYHGIFAPGAALREEIVPARGGRCAHNKRKGKPKVDKDAVKKAAGNDDSEAAERAASRKLTWADALKRAFFFDILACPCGGRRQVIAAIRQPAAVEKILKHVKLWREDSDKDDSEIIAIRGPPEALMPQDEPPDDRWDGWDEPQELDWVA